MSSPSWTDRIDFNPISTSSTDDVDDTTRTPKLNEHQPVRVVSWNTLADQYRRYQQSQRPFADRIIFDKEYRHPLLGECFQKFVSLDVDFICLQEVDFKIARLALQDTHTRLLTPTGHGFSDTRVDACCIFYRTSKWKLVGEAPKIVSLDDLAPDYVSDDDSDEDNLHATTFTPPEPHIDELTECFLRGNFGIIACLENLSTGARIVICNTHLYWNPAMEFVKLCQAHYLCLAVQQFIRENEFCNEEDTPVVLLGDLNSKPGSLVHTYLQDGQVVSSSGTDSSNYRAPATLELNRCTQFEVGRMLQQESLECPFAFESAYDNAKAATARRRRKATCCCLPT